ncbi:MAG: hypothetical protein AAF368_00070 [Planctomycetota bacterium]
MELMGALKPTTALTRAYRTAERLVRRHEATIEYTVAYQTNFGGVECIHVEFQETNGEWARVCVVRADWSMGELEEQIRFVFAQQWGDDDD